ncbi:MAG: hypothetical protein AAGJ08_13395 [Cyanobacteria bacterium P01_H01_bin.35]
MGEGSPQEVGTLQKGVRTESGGMGIIEEAGGRIVRVIFLP